ncbi:(2Fe-2S)-binding protein, partial [Escherichia sp. SS-MK2]
TAASLLHKAGEECELDVATMSANDTICGCNGVTKGTIVHAILEQELTTFEEVKGCTKAAGSCISSSFFNMLKRRVPSAVSPYKT